MTDRRIDPGSIGNYSLNSAVVLRWYMDAFTGLVGAVRAAST